GWAVHVHTLYQATGEKHQGHESNAINRGPEMDLDERGETPFATDQSRHDVIHRSEHDHAEKGVETEVAVSNADLAELEVTRERAQRNDDTEHAKRGVGHGAKNRETQCRAVTHERKIAAHGHVMIQANCRD